MWRLQHTCIGFLVSLTRFSSPNESCDFLQRLLCPLETLTAAAPRRDAQQPMPKLFRNLQRELELIRECFLCRQKMLILTKYIELNFIERFKVQPQSCSKAKTRSASCQGNSPKNIPTGAPEICNVPGLGKQTHLLSFTFSCIHKSGQNTSFCDLLRNGRTSAPGLRC